jgi:hypothetical protein
MLPVAVLLLLIAGNKNLAVWVTPNSVTCLPNFSTTGQLVQKLKGGPNGREYPRGYICL